MMDEWVNPNFRLAELLKVYGPDFEEFMQDREYSPDQARKTFIKFFDSVGKGEEIRKIFSELGV
jgi:hypothetical protein